MGTTEQKRAKRSDKNAQQDKEESEDVSGKAKCVGNVAVGSKRARERERQKEREKEREKGTVGLWAVETCVERGGGAGR